MTSPFAPIRLIRVVTARDGSHPTGSGAFWSVLPQSRDLTGRGQGGLILSRTSRSAESLCFVKPAVGSSCGGCLASLMLGYGTPDRARIDHVRLGKGFAEEALGRFGIPRSPTAGN